MSKKVATLTVQAYFDGTYYDTNELVDLLHDWISSALWDRDDLIQWDVYGTAEEMDWDE